MYWYAIEIALVCVPQLWMSIVIFVLVVMMHTIVVIFDLPVSVCMYVCLSPFSIVLVLHNNPMTHKTIVRTVLWLFLGQSNENTVLFMFRCHEKRSRSSVLSFLWRKRKSRLRFHPKYLHRTFKHWKLCAYERKNISCTNHNGLWRI